MPRPLHTRRRPARRFVPPDVPRPITVRDRALPAPAAPRRLRKHLCSPIARSSSLVLYNRPFARRPGPPVAKYTPIQHMCACTCPHKLPPCPCTPQIDRRHATRVPLSDLRSSLPAAAASALADRSPYGIHRPVVHSTASAPATSSSPSASHFVCWSLEASLPNPRCIMRVPATLDLTPQSQPSTDRRCLYHQSAWTACGLCEQVSSVVCKLSTALLRVARHAARALHLPRTEHLSACARGATYYLHRSALTVCPIRSDKRKKINIKMCRVSCVDDRKPRHDSCDTRHRTRDRFRVLICYNLCPNLLHDGDGDGDTAVLVTLREHQLTVLFVSDGLPPASTSPSAAAAAGRRPYIHYI